MLLTDSNSGIFNRGFDNPRGPTAHSGGLPIIFNLKLIFEKNGMKIKDGPKYKKLTYKNLLP